MPTDVLRGRPRPGTVRVVCHDDNLATARAIRALGDPGAGIAVASVKTPKESTGERAYTNFADALLDGMGKDRHLFSVKRRVVPLATAWLHARPWTVIIPDCGLFAPETVLAVTDWLRSTGADVYLCVPVLSEQRPDAERMLLMRRYRDALGADIIYLQDLLDQIGTSPRPSRRTRSPWPRVPRSDGFCFRADCRRLLSPAQSDFVDGEFMKAKRRLQAEISPDGEGRYSQDRAKGVLRSHMEEASCTDELITIVRAAQVGLEALWYVKVSTLEFLGAAAICPRRGALEAQGLWQALDLYRDPDVGAVCALYLHGVDREVIGMLRLDEVDLAAGATSPQTLHMANGTITIPPGPARFLWVLSAYRTLAGAVGSDPLFDTHSKRTAKNLGPHDRYVRTVLEYPALEHGIEVVRGRLYQNKVSTDNWLKQFGIEFHLQKPGVVKATGAKRPTRRNG